MSEISSRDYALMVEDKIEDDIEARLYVTYNALGKRFGFPPILGESAESRFSEMFRDGYAAKMRDLAIEFFEEYGFDVRPDGRSW